MSRVIFDIDGVLGDFNSYCEQLLGIPADPTAYSAAQRWPGREEPFLKILHDPKTYYRLTTIRGAIQAVERYRISHEIFAVTARDYGNKSEMEYQTLRWFEKHGFPFRSVTVTTVEKKVPIIKEMLYGIDGYAIDDSPFQIQEMINKNVPYIIFNQLWNQDIPGTRIHGWI